MGRWSKDGHRGAFMCAPKASPAVLWRKRAASEIQKHPQPVTATCWRRRKRDTRERQQRAVGICKVDARRGAASTGGRQNEWPQMTEKNEGVLAPDDLARSERQRAAARCPPGRHAAEEWRVLQTM